MNRGLLSFPGHRSPAASAAGQRSLDRDEPCRTLPSMQPAKRPVSSSRAATGGSRWLVKTEPDVFSYADLERDAATSWDGVRNYQARNNLRLMRLGDLVLVYHSNAAPPGVVGIAEVVAEHVPDPTQFDPTSEYFDPTAKEGEGRWSMVRLAARRPLRLVPLDELRRIPELAGSRLIAPGNRLSVLSLTGEEFDAIVAAGKEDRV